MSGGGGGREGGRGGGALSPSVGGGRHGGHKHHRRHASSKDASLPPSLPSSLPPSGLPKAVGKIEEEEEEEEDGFEGVALLVLLNAASCWGRIVSFPIFVCLLVCLNVVGVNAWLRWRAGGRKGGRKRVMGGGGGGGEGGGGGVAALGLGETQRRRSRGVSVVRAFSSLPPSLPLSFRPSYAHLPTHSPLPPSPSGRRRHFPRPCQVSSYRQHCPAGPSPILPREEEGDR